MIPRLICFFKGHDINKESIRDMSHIYLWSRYEDSNYRGWCSRCKRYVRV